MTTTATWYHASLTPIGRSAGRSAVACAAYRTGGCLQDVRYGLLRDFSAKGDVVVSFTLAPEGSPAWATDAEALWNAVEAKEKRKDSQLAFEWEVALPNELAAPEREAIAREFSGWLMDEYGVAVTVGIHHGGERGNGCNDHMHVMMTTRAVGPEGFAAKKLAAFSTAPGKPNLQVERVRERIADVINDALVAVSSDYRVDHRSFKARGIEREPTTHLGPAATAMERKHHPEHTELGDTNRAILEERLAWQREQAAPEITRALEEEFALRFGDPLPEEERLGDPVPGDIVEHATDGRETAPPDIAAAGETVLPPPRGWRDRMRSLAESFRALLRDETSGAPDPERGIRVTAEAVREGIAVAGDAARSFAERVMERGRALWGNERGCVPGDDLFGALLAAVQDAGPEPGGVSAEQPITDSPGLGLPGRDGPELG